MLTYPLEIFKKHALATITELREVDMYLEQDSTKDTKTALYAAPALFIEFSFVSKLRTHGQQIQSAIVDITFHLLTETLHETGSKRMKKETPKDHMMIYDKIFKNFQGFGSKISFLPAFASLKNTPNDYTVMNSLSRVDQSLPHKFRKAMMKSSQTFRCVIYDHAALKQYTTPPTAPALDLDMLLSLEFNDEETFDDSFDESFG
jgi:hypothetical protein